MSYFTVKIKLFLVVVICNFLLSTANNNTSDTTELEKEAVSCPDCHHCSSGDLVGGLGLFVQALLAFLAFTSLILKRFCEPKKERRPWIIWFYDTSKQALGAALIHFTNVFLASIFSDDPCTWYVVSFLLDSTIGLFVICLGLKIAQCIIRKRRCDTLQFGEYGTPPQCNAWVGQCGVYMFVMIIEKILMTLLMLFPFWLEVRKFILSPIKSKALEIIVVMFIVPLIVNAVIFWVVDNYLKRQIKSTNTLSINDDDLTVKYFRSQDKLKYYSKVEWNGEIESDILLSQDEDSDNKYRSLERVHSDGTERLINSS